MEIKIWKTTLYLRLSREDMLSEGVADKSESNSITGQRELLRDYLTKHPELQEVAARVDAFSQKSIGVDRISSRPRSRR